MKTQKEIEEAIKNQKEVAAKWQSPMFAPYNGICWGCNRQIYEVEDGKHYITGCPYCHRSYCD